jgi:hypothetical protein
VQCSWSTVADTSAPDLPGTPRVVRETQRFGTIIVVGGGCYGGYYVRQLARAERAGALAWRRLLVVDRDPACAVSRLAPAERPSSLEIVVAEWRAFFAGYLGAAANEDAGALDDAIVPSPLMPHLMADWLMDRARERWPLRAVAIEPLVQPPAVRWERPGDDGTHYVSFADWICPINCIEPERCPHTRGPRDWSMPVAVREFVQAEVAAGRPMEGPYLFRCLHRAYGVGMLDVGDILDADRAIAARGTLGPAAFLVGTVSQCHGALRRIELGV